MRELTSITLIHLLSLRLHLLFLFLKTKLWSRILTRLIRMLILSCLRFQVELIEINSRLIPLLVSLALYLLRTLRTLKIRAMIMYLILNFLYQMDWS